MMIPGQWDGPPRGALAPAAARHAAAPAPQPSPVTMARRERPSWLRVLLFAAPLLTATWLALWLAGASR